MWFNCFIPKEFRHESTCSMYFRSTMWSLNLLCGCKRPLAKSGQTMFFFIWLTVDAAKYTSVVGLRFVSHINCCTIHFVLSYPVMSLSLTDMHDGLAGPNYIFCSRCSCSCSLSSHYSKKQHKICCTNTAISTSIFHHLFAWSTTFLLAVRINVHQGLSSLLCARGNSCVCSRFFALVYKCVFW